MAANSGGRAGKSPHLQLPSLPQIRVDARLPTAAGLAIGGEHVGIEAQLHRLLQTFQRRAAAPHELAALPNLGAVEKFFGQWRCVVRINPCGGAA